MRDLTPHQRQVLCMVTLSNREIAMRLGISQQTVKNLLTKVYKHLGVADHTRAGNRTQALMLALREGIVTLDEVELPPPPGWCWERVDQARAARWRE